MKHQQQSGGAMIGPTSRLILIVDDLPLNRAVLAEIVIVAGFTAIEAKDGRDALEKIRTFRPFLVFMDIEMPVMDGISAIRELRADPAFRDLPVIAVSGLRTDAARRRALEAGFSMYIFKPCSAKEILGALRTLAVERGGQDSEGPR